MLFRSVWLENLNLRGSYKPVILDYIRKRHSELSPLYEEIYNHGSRLYWETLNAALREYAKKNRLEYVRNDDSMQKSFDAPPTLVNFFYHEEIRKSAKKRNGRYP